MDRADDAAPGRLRRALLPVLLTVGAVGGAAGAFMFDDPPEAAPLGVAAGAPSPVLSARRAPELLVGPVAERRMAPLLQAWIDQSPDDSCLVVEVAGVRVFNHRGDASLPSASVQKVVTATAALEVFGPDHRFETVAASSAEITDGVLRGDLYVIGGGDPLLITEAYGNQMLRGQERMTDVGELADAIQAAGVTGIEGDVVGDESRYDTDRFHDGWPDRFRAQNQSGPVSALNVNHGFSDFPAEYGGPAARVRADDPAANAAGVIKGELEARGITVSGSARSGEAPGDVRQVAVLESAPLIDILAQMLIDSDNLTGELLMKELGLAEHGEGTWTAGPAAVESVLSGAGVGLENAEIVDGSGLSHQNRVTCDLVVDLLTDPTNGPLVVDSLAVAGESGTLRTEYEGTAVAGRVRGKTGTLRNVNALAGQAEPHDGGVLYFAYSTHVAEPQELTWEQTQLVHDLPDLLVGYSADVNMDELLPRDFPGGG